MPNQNAAPTFDNMPPNQNMGTMDNPPMNEPLNSEEDDFNGSEFNNEVESDDPKKNIQKLTGKLSQELRKYNDEQEKPDTELNKYVAGMIIPQASVALTNDDKEDIIDKINKGVDVDNESTPNDDGDNEGDNPNDNEAMPMESKISEAVNEVFNDMINTARKKQKNKMSSTSLPSNPFISNR